MNSYTIFSILLTIILAFTLKASLNAKIDDLSMDLRDCEARVKNKELELIRLEEKMDEAINKICELEEESMKLIKEMEKSDPSCSMCSIHKKIQELETIYKVTQEDFLNIIKEHHDLSEKIDVDAIYNSISGIETKE